MRNNGKYRSRLERDRGQFGSEEELTGRSDQKENRSSKVKRRRVKENFNSDSSKSHSRSDGQRKSQRVLSGGPKKVDNMERSLKSGKPGTYTEASMNRVMQGAIRKYRMERGLFQQLLDLKRLQIRNSRANEHVMIKRLIDEYGKNGAFVDVPPYNGPYTFSGYEKYVYDQIRNLQLAQGSKIPKFKNNEEVENLTRALRKANVPDFNQYLEDRERSAHNCNHTTHRCHHAIHAYTGVPCAAYLAQQRRNQKAGKVNLPKIEQNYNVKAPDAGRVSVNQDVDSQKGPLKLELQHGNSTQRFALPTNFLDQSQNYQLTVSIQPSKKNKNNELNIRTETENLVKAQDPVKRSSSTRAQNTRLSSNSEHTSSANAKYGSSHRNI